MANSASLLLPVSNLTNLLALPSLGFTFTGFAATIAPVLAVVLVVEYAGLRLLFRGDLAVPARPTPAPAVTSPLDVDPCWVAGLAAVVLSAWAGRRDLVDARAIVRATHPEFALLVLALGVVVAAISEGFLGEAVGDLVPSSTSFAGLLVVAGWRRCWPTCSPTSRPPSCSFRWSRRSATSVCWPP